MYKPFATSLIDRYDIAENTLEFVLQRPDGFEFKAGQHINVKLSELIFDDKRGQRRTFTVASAPHENILRMATRKTGSGFKRTIESGPLQPVEVIGPSGKMIRDESRPAVFIAGGMGITPFRSMIADAMERQLTQPMTLLFSNRYAAEIAFSNYFLSIQKDHQNTFTCIQTITDKNIQNGEWSGENRRIDSEFIKDYVPDLSAVTFYVCGPPDMVAAQLNILKNENVSQEYILSESFWGY